MTATARRFTNALVAGLLLTACGAPDADEPAGADVDTTPNDPVDDGSDEPDTADHPGDEDPSAVDDHDRDQPEPPTTDDDEGDDGEIAPRCSDLDEIEEDERAPSTELSQVKRDIGESWDTEAQENAFYAQPEPGSLTSVGVSQRVDRVRVGIVGGDDDVLREFTERFGAELVCLHVMEPPEPVAAEQAVTTLARTDRADDVLDDHRAEAFDEFSSVLVIASDEAAARRLWDDHVPDDLEPADHDPDEPGPPGLYGSLDDVDHDRQAIVSWTSGDSGSCPEWLAGLSTDDDAVEVHMRGVGWGRSCSDDYRFYTQVGAVDRDQLPDLDALPLELTADDDFRVHVQLGQAVRYPE